MNSGRKKEEKTKHLKSFNYNFALGRDSLNPIATQGIFIDVLKKLDYTNKNSDMKIKIDWMSINLDRKGNPMSNSELPANNVPNRNERRKQKTKENVRKAAIETFLEVGYLNATIQDIMVRADLGYGTFYQYYKSKQDIIVELANEAREIIKKDYVFLPETETSLYKRTISKLEVVFKTYAKHRDVLKILLECHHADEELHRAWNQLMEAPFKAMKKDLTWNMNQGLCRDVDLNTAIIALHGMVQTTGVYIVQNNLTEQEIDKITKDVGVLLTQAIYIKDDSPEFWRKNNS